LPFVLSKTIMTNCCFTYLPHHIYTLLLFRYISQQKTNLCPTFFFLVLWHALIHLTTNVNIFLPKAKCKNMNKQIIFKSWILLEDLWKVECWSMDCRIFLFVWKTFPMSYLFMYKPSWHVVGWFSHADKSLEYQHSLI
jgi:hypothetical protein